jgi:hypothetical protein
VVEFHIYDNDEFDFEVLSIAGCYDFHRIKISQEEFIKIPVNTAYRKEKAFKLNTFRIDRHVLMKQFTIDVSYEFHQNPERIYSSRYTFEVSFLINIEAFQELTFSQVPYFQRDTRLMFKFLDQFYAESGITTLYNNYNFKRHPEMPEKIKELLNEIE